MHRIWHGPDGKVAMTHFPDSRDAAGFQAGEFSGWSYIDVDDAAYASMVPADRTTRDQWRFRDSRIVVDTTIETIRPKDIALQELDAATDLTEVKLAIRKLFE